MTMAFRRNKLLTAVEAGEALLAKWVAEESEAATELATLESAAPDQVLDDPDAFATVPRRRQELRDRLEVAQGAVRRAGERLSVARSAVTTTALQEEAAMQRRRLEAGRKALQEFEERHAQLLGALQEHAGERYVPDPYVEPGTGPKIVMPRYSQLAGEVTASEKALEALDAALVGQDPLRVVPGLRAAQLPPALWGPDAVAPVSQYLESVATARGNLVAAEARLVEWERELGVLFADHPDMDEAEVRRVTRELTGYGDPRSPAQVRFAELLLQQAEGRVAVDGYREHLAALVPAAVPVAS